MWTPPERIRHSLPEPAWPEAEVAARSRLFSPTRLGNHTLESRSWVPAMVPWRSNEAGEVTRDVLEWYERFALGQPAVLVVEATGIRDIPSGPLLRIGHDRYLEGLSALVQRVQQASQGKTRLFIQLIDFLALRRRPDPDKFFARFLEIDDRIRQFFPGQGDPQIRQLLVGLEPSRLEEVLSPRQLEALRLGSRERVTDLHLEHIRQLPQTLPGVFAGAARRAQAAGFDGVELHYAHAYTMASFLSGLNHRQDGYGGSREARLRLPLEVYQAVRQAVGPKLAVGCRYLAEEAIEGGYPLEDACFYGVELARAGMDFLSLSRGGKFEDAKQPAVGWAVYPYTGPSGYECMPTFLSDARGPFGRNAESVRQIRQALRSQGLATPVVLTGGLCSFEQAEGWLSQGYCDLVGSARQSLADPDWFLKMRLGRGSEVRRCKFSNYCEGLDQKHKQVTCQLWDRLQLEDPEVRLSQEGKRRLTAPRWQA